MRQHPGAWPEPLGGPDVSEATPVGGSVLDGVVDSVISRLRGGDALTEQTLDRFEALIRQFVQFAERGHGVTQLREVTGVVVEAYVRAPTSDGADPSLSLQHFRRSGVRVLYRTCRQLGMDVGDPSLDVVLPPRDPGGFRPLADAEVEVARASAVAAQRDTRAAAAWAMCEATARTGELPWLRWEHVDFAGARVWIAGTPRTLPRWGYLTDWGRLQVARHHRACRQPDSSRMFPGGRPGSALAQSTAVGTISRILADVGLDASRGVRPSSVAAWAGWKVFEQTGRIEVVARSVGLRSLDRTAVFIGWDPSEDG